MFFGKGPEAMEAMNHDAWIGLDGIGRCLIRRKNAASFSEEPREWYPIERDPTERDCLKDLQLELESDLARLEKEAYWVRARISKVRTARFMARKPG